MTRRIAFALIFTLGAVSALAQRPGSAGAFIEGGTDIYGVGIMTGIPGATTGRYGIWAEEAHPASVALGWRANIATHFADCFPCRPAPTANYSFVRSWVSRTDYRLGSVNVTFPFGADPGFECTDVNLDSMPVIEQIFESGEAVGVRSTWDIVNGQDDLQVELLLKVHGGDAVDSAVEVSLRVRNFGDELARVGIRHWWAPRMRLPFPEYSQPGGYIGVGPPSPPLGPYLAVETEWERPSFRTWELSAFQEGSPSGPSPYYTAGLVAGFDQFDPPPTPPDLLQRGNKDSSPGSALSGGASTDSCFLWRIPDPPRTIPWQVNNTSLVAYWGHEEDNAIHLDPGGEVTVTQYFVAYVSNPIRVSAVGPYEAECRGGLASTELDGRWLIEPATSAELHHRWSSTDPRVRFEDPTDPRTIVHVDGAGTFPLEYTLKAGVYEASASTTLEVVDLEPPRFVDLSVQPGTLWPPNHRMHEVDVSIEVADDCDTAPAVRLVSVESNQLQRWLPGAGAGHTDEDIADAELGTDDRTISLRAERSGVLQTPRIYTLTHEATDASGNATREEVTVEVKHDRGGRR